jgi:hypothetical protein
MTGIIYDINPQRGMVAVQTENEDFSIFEIVSQDAIEIGQKVSWKETHPAASTIITNHTTGVRFRVLFQNHQVSKLKLDQQLLRE